MDKLALGRISGLVVLALGLHSGSPIGSSPSPFSSSESSKLVASDGSVGALLGQSVAVSGQLAVLGAPGDADGGTSSGAAYVFAFDGDEWEEDEKLLAGDGTDLDSFGTSVAIDGESIVIGAPLGDNNWDRTGSAYVFVFDRGGWEEQDELTPSNGEEWDQFGQAVSISGDTVVVGADWANPQGPLSGSAYVFERSRDRWSQEDILEPSDGDAADQFGFSVAVFGDTAVVGAPYASEDRIESGASYVFTRERTRWSQQDKLHPGDGEIGDDFGWSVALGAELAVIGAPSADGLASSSGAAYVFVREDDTWSEHSKLVAADGASDDEFGASVAISDDYIVVGAPGDDRGATDTGAVYLFVRTQDVWIEREKLYPHESNANALTGLSSGVSGDIALAGSPGDAENGADSGAAFAFHVDYTHTLTVSLMGTGSGTVSSSPQGIACAPDCEEEFTVDTPVSLTPEPGNDSVFVAWGGDEDCQDGMVTMTGDMACTATFDLQVHHLSVLKTGTGSGTVTSNPPGIDCGSDCSEPYTPGTEVTLTAEPDLGSSFEGWSGDPDCTDGRVTMMTDRSCEARFLTDSIFSDGFESGDCTSWAAQLPVP